jgi:Asp-tRNA(Asn)/Glu-tRNA(Gln) amidotransferase B subunit
MIFINKNDMGKDIVLTEKQLEKLVDGVKNGKIVENHEKGSYMAKQQLFTIALMAYKMWEEIEDGEQIEDWMESKIAQAEQSVNSVVKAYMYDELVDHDKGMSTLNYDEIVIGK